LKRPITTSGTLAPFVDSYFLEIEGENMFRKINILMTTLVLIFLIGTSCIQQQIPGIKYEEEVYDFGIKDEGPNIEHEFIFTNTGNQTLKILDVKPDCSCTVADNWDQTVAPGKSGKIHITLKTTGLQGDVLKAILVKTNIPNRENIELTLKVNIKTSIAIIPRNVWLGEFLPTDNKSHSGTFEIDNNLGVPLKILEVTPPDDRTKFTLTTIEQNKKYKIDFTVNPPFVGEATVKGEFRIKTDNKDYPEIVPTFSYFIPPPLMVFPTTVNIDLDQLKGYVIPFVTTINIKSTMEKPIRIQDLKLIGGKGITYEILEATKDLVYQILITIPLDYAYHKDEKVYFVFSVLNDPKNKQYNVPVHFIKKENH
jgi:hypothetical protein